MKKSIILSLIIMLSGIAIGGFLNNWTLTIKICGLIGLATLFISGVINGTFVSGYRDRDNYSIDTMEDNLQKNKISNFAIAVGLPNIILAVIVFIIIN